jgi:hypothetical protein
MLPFNALSAAVRANRPGMQLVNTAGELGIQGSEELVQQELTMVTKAARPSKQALKA